MTMRNIPRKTRVTADLFNRIIDQANRSDQLRVGQGLIISRSNEGTVINLAESPDFLREPAVEVEVVNDGDTDLPALSIAGIIGDVRATDVRATEGDLVSERVLRVRQAKACDAGNICIVTDLIPKGGNVGTAWIGGVCLVNMVRWFRSDLLNTVECFAGQNYGIATAGGSLDIISEMMDYNGNPIIGTEHLAVVRFNGRRFIRWVNKGTTTVKMGDPIARTSTEDDGMTDGPGSATPPRFDVLTMKSPKDQVPTGDGFINMGGDVAAGQDGVCAIPASEPTLIRANSTSTFKAGDTVGPAFNTIPFSASGVGYHVLAWLGQASDGNKYAIAHASADVGNYRTIQIVSGNTLASGQTGVKYVAAGVGSVPAAYDPNVTSSFIDGIGRGTLYIDNQAQSGYVLLVLDSRTTMNFDVLANEVVVVKQSVDIPVGATTTTVTCWIPVGLGM